MSTKSTEQLLQENGWTMECQSPLEIRHTDGSFATQQAAHIVLGELQAQSQATPDSNLQGREALVELVAVADRLQSVVNIAAEQGTESAWAVAYSMVFSPRGSQRAYELMEALNIEEFEGYFDPDTTYEADTRAYVEALQALKEKVAPFLPAA